MDALLRCFQSQLPEEVVSLVETHLIKRLEDGDYEAILTSDQAKALFANDNNELDPSCKDSKTWSDVVFQNLGTLLSDRDTREQQATFFCIGYAALLAFLQSNVTGPPLPFSASHTLFPRHVSAAKANIQRERQALVQSLGVDGIAAYKLTPNVELLCLADAVMTAPALLQYIPMARWAKLRVAFIHQRLLSEPSSTLQKLIYEDLGMLGQMLQDTDEASAYDNEAVTGFLIERSTIHTYYGYDKLAREDLEAAARLHGFEFALTGLMGRRTKFQQKDTSQLVVLARSQESESAKVSQGNGSSVNILKTDHVTNGVIHPANGSSEGGTEITDELISNTPQKLDLNDDTLLESIEFTETPHQDSTSIRNTAPLSANLAKLDPSDQPKLQALDSTVLLSLASSITNTSPEDGLTREETLPYATRVLDGGSSNWQVYTQALLVRSRIEGYRSRTVERGLLQLQALVDQVIADTTNTSSEALDVPQNETEIKASSFLPRAKDASETAPASQRLQYIFQLASPTRWDLEAELANRWVQLGGMRSALDIYERLEMWAEAALCWAATEREDKAKSIVRRQLFHAKGGRQAEDDERWEGKARVPPPLDAPRLYCILGDLDQDVDMWEKAWEVSKNRYARAQRSLGRYYLVKKDLLKSAAAYSKSLSVNQLNHASWFALGCVLLELFEFERAAEAFSRCVQLDDTDAEAWSNFAAALLKMNPDADDSTHTGFSHKLDDDEEDDVVTIPTAKRDPQKNRQDALKALKRAASLKRDSYRIWQNILVVAASLSPPDYSSLLSAQRQVIVLRGKVDGEKCVDFEILNLLVQHVITTEDTYDPSRPGLPRMMVRFIDSEVVPLITASTDLWRMVGKLALWRKKPLTALEAEEKAWRAVTNQPGWETASEQGWDTVVEATVRLCDSYESLGMMQRTEGMGAGEPVAKDWKFKARTAVRGIMGRGKDTFEDTEGWTRLQETVQSLRG